VLLHLGGNADVSLCVGYIIYSSMIRKSNEITLKEAIEALLLSYKLTDKLDETRLIACWEKVVGKLIGRHTEGMYVKSRTLFVKLDSAALRNELAMAKSKLIINLNRTAGKEVIDDIRFT
jgi:predicted nucleic acid-binding Zn ribbon protein